MALIFYGILLIQGENQTLAGQGAFKLGWRYNSGQYGSQIIHSSRISKPFQSKSELLDSEIVDRDNRRRRD